MISSSTHVNFYSWNSPQPELDSSFISQLNNLEHRQHGDTFDSKIIRLSLQVRYTHLSSWANQTLFRTSQSCVSLQFWFLGQCGHRGNVTTSFPSSPSRCCLMIHSVTLWLDEQSQSRALAMFQGPNSYICVRVVLSWLKTWPILALEQILGLK